MKKNLAIFPLLALLAGACTNPLDYQSGQSASVLVMNAMLRTDETTHVIWLSNSTVDKLFVVKDAELTCYINDEFVAKAIPVRPTEPVDDNFEEKSKYYKAGGSIATAYLLKATIKPGDKVRLVADWYDLHASATALAPQAPVLAAVDTVRTQSSPYSDPDAPVSALVCRFRLEDRPGEENWYRLCVSYEADAVDCRGEQTHWQGAVPFSYYKDPVLNDGFRTPDDDKALSSLFDLLNSHIYSKYCSFSDKAFADKAVETEINILDPYMSPWWITHARDEQDDQPTQLRIRFDLLSLSKEEYFHLWGLTNAQRSGLEWNPLFEPVRLPDNVEGGLGLVTVASATSLTLDPVPITGTAQEETGD